METAPAAGAISTTHIIRDTPPLAAFGMAGLLALVVGALRVPKLPRFARCEPCGNSDDFPKRLLWRILPAFAVDTPRSEQ